LVLTLLFGTNRWLAPSATEKLLDLARNLPHHDPVWIARLAEVPAPQQQDWLLQLVDTLQRKHDEVTYVRTAFGLLTAFNANPSRRGLLPVLTSHFASWASNYPLPLKVKDLATLDASAFVDHSDDEPVVRRAVAWLRLASGRWTEQDLQPLVARFNLSTYNAQAGLSQLIALNWAVEDRNHVDLLKRLVAGAWESTFEYSTLLDSLSGIEDARLSVLAAPKHRQQLRLPSPVAV
jgi:hypothetical protein